MPATDTEPHGGLVVVAPHRSGEDLVLRHLRLRLLQRHGLTETLEVLRVHSQDGLDPVALLIIDVGRVLGIRVRVRAHSATGVELLDERVVIRSQILPDAMLLHRTIPVEPLHLLDQLLVVRKLGRGFGDVALRTEVRHGRNGGHRTELVAVDLLLKELVSHGIGNVVDRLLVTVGHLLDESVAVNEVVSHINALHDNLLNPYGNHQNYGDNFYAACNFYKLYFIITHFM